MVETVEQKLCGGTSNRSVGESDCCTAPETKKVVADSECELGDAEDVGVDAPDSLRLFQRHQPC